MKYKQQGMTLVEVLIAGVILFIAISIISIVSRTKILNEQRLLKAIDIAYLAEYAQPIIKYHLQYTQDRQGRISIAGTEYSWSSKVKETKPLVISLASDASISATENEKLLTLYNILITRVDSKKAMLEFIQLI